MSPGATLMSCYAMIVQETPLTFDDGKSATARREGAPGTTAAGRTRQLTSSQHTVFPAAARKLCGGLGPARGDWTSGPCGCSACVALTDSPFRAEDFFFFFRYP